MRTLMTLALLLASISPALAQARSPYLEDHTWPELEALMAAGTTTAVVMAGGIEQNGPHMAFVKHNLIARHISGQVAQRLGNALAYPVIPFSMAGEWTLVATGALPDGRRITSDVERTDVVSGFPGPSAVEGSRTGRTAFGGGGRRRRRSFGGKTFRTHR